MSRLPNDLENPETVRMIKERFSPDGGAEREHNADEHGFGFVSIHHAMVRNLRPRNVLVIGSRYGLVPVVVAMALRANGQGSLDFVDANYSDDAHGFEQAFGGVGHWEQSPGQAFEDAGLGDLIELYIQRSDEFFTDHMTSYGYIYVDGDHTYEGSRHDIDQSLSRLEDGGILAVHDVVVEYAPFGVRKAFAEVDPDRYQKIIIPSWPGLGLIQAR